jgi:hypothetical protein
MATAKQLQHHGHRAARGQPKHTARFAFRCTPAQHRRLMKLGGALWIRRQINGGTR